MPLKKKLGLTAAVGCIAVGALGAGAAPASALSLTTGQNSPQGTRTVTAPDAAIPGAVNAFTQVITKGPGTLSNISITP